VLDEEGLAVALTTLIRGLSSRMRIRIDLVCDVHRLRSSPEVEYALYRVVQEALINVHKHAAATRAEVRYYHRRGGLVLEVEDDGIGMDCESELAMATGVGIQGMCARVAQLGGTLTLSSPARGVLVRAVFPVIEASWGFQPCETFLLPITERKEGLP
jgi:signal transduction histidine kinase